MFQIKICGITSVDDARMAADAGADAVGLNFYNGSPRYLSDAAAETVAAAVPAGVARVGVFVNPDVDNVRQLFERLRLDYVQLHGDETLKVLANLADLPVIRAFRVARDLASIVEFLSRCREARCLPRGVLMDANVPGKYGGSGMVADWETAASYALNEANPPLILAGGLTPANVAAAIGAVRPMAVDVASGVERSAGPKDERLVREFVTAAREAFASLDQYGDE